ncbi:HAD family hydrolase [Frankia sp. Cas4]|uniref:HAD family hydrolase n=1 Tax=Frankia sp. Cas4 TaxID=3073927 RepID=UPI002AD2B844|nr:haloacid dehalogenase-like hydrolase [Frankia sp. Cas4]
MTAPALILWDVDHTLLEIKGVSREIYARAFQLVTGRPMEQLADMTGRTERAIIIETLRLGGITDPEPLMPAFYEALGEAAQQLQDRMRESGRALPGAREAITALVVGGIVQSVVTGNLRSIARTKLAAFGLTDHLDLEVGGYGDDDSDRAVLVRLAVKRSEAAHGVTFPPERVVVLGDTPHDVKGAHDAGVRAVGVATGSSTARELEATGADAVLPRLTDITALRTAVFG